MPRTIILILLLLFFCVLFSCSPSKNIVGTYRNKFAIADFFGTTIKLMQGDSLQYIFQGDLLYDKIIGHYKTHDDTLYIHFEKEVSDTNMRSAIFNIPLKTITYKNDTITYNVSYFIGHNKLFPIHLKTGKKVTKARKYNKRKKYLLFGSHYYDKRYYLKKLN